jgi:hypothetical protein
MMDITAPPIPPGMSNISGQVSDGLATTISAPIGNVAVMAWDQFAPNATFGRSTMTSTNGVYGLDVFPDMSYALWFDPNNN